MSIRPHCLPRSHIKRDIFDHENCWARKKLKITILQIDEIFLSTCLGDGRTPDEERL